MSEYDDRIAKLEAQIRSIKEERDAEAKRLRDTVKPEWRITIAPVTDGRDKLLDDSVLWYKIDGQCVNKEACIVAGHPVRDLDGGGLNYLYNTLSHRIIMSGGGGRLWFSDWGSHNRPNIKVAYERAMDLISAFLSANPGGGDLTELHADYERWSREEVA